MNGTVLCWLKEQMGWLHPNDFLDCMHLDTSLHWAIVATQMSASGLIALLGFLYWGTRWIPTILVRIVVGLFIVGLFLNSLT